MDHLDDSLDILVGIGGFLRELGVRGAPHHDTLSFEGPADLVTGADPFGGGATHRASRAVTGAAEAQRERRIGACEHVRRRAHAPGDEHRLSHAAIALGRLRMRGTERASAPLRCTHNVSVPCALRFAMLCAMS